jgi:hypothetical protein
MRGRGRTSRRRSRWRLPAWHILVLGCVVSAAAARAGDLLPGEYQVKAAFLFNFAKFVEWPSEAFPAPDTPFGLCILGDEPPDADIEFVLKGKKVGPREIHYRRLRTSQELGGCHLLFVGEAATYQLDAVPRDSILTVGEAAVFIRRGGVIRFLMEDGRVRFEINPDAALKSRLKISSKLLKLARIVR